MRADFEQIERDYRYIINGSPAFFTNVLTFVLVFLSFMPLAFSVEDCSGISFEVSESDNEIEEVSVRAFVEKSRRIIKFFVGKDTFENGRPNYRHYQGEDHNAPFTAKLTIFDADSEITVAAYTLNGSLDAYCTGDSEPGGSSGSGGDGVRPTYIRTTVWNPRVDSLPLGVGMQYPRISADQFCRDIENKTHAVRWTLTDDVEVEVEVEVGQEFRFFNPQTNRWDTDTVSNFGDDDIVGSFFVNVRCATPTLRPVSILRKTHRSETLYAAGFCLQAEPDGRVNTQICNGFESQKWHFNSNVGQVRSVDNRCLTARPTAVTLASCDNERAEQRWNWGNRSPGNLRSRAYPQLCLLGPDPNGAVGNPVSANASRTVLGQCHGSDDEQLWYLDERASPVMVVMGDSYASGEGLDSFDYSTDSYMNRCHRSGLSYGPTLAKEWDHRLVFSACSGALTGDILWFDDRTDHGGQYQEGSQIYRLAGAPRSDRNPKIGIVTLSIGGNDIGFPSLIIGCIATNKCDEDMKDAFDDNLNKLANRQHDSSYMYQAVSKLANVYLEIGRRAPNAQIRVLDYPPVMGTGGCKVEILDLPVVDFPLAEFDEKETKFLADAGTRLNQVIASAVNEARIRLGERIRLVRTNGLINNSLCSNDSWIRNIYPPLATIGARAFYEMIECVTSLPPRLLAGGQAYNDLFYCLSTKSSHPKVAEISRKFYNSFHPKLQAHRNVFLPALKRTFD